MKYSQNQFIMGTSINITVFSNENPLEDIYNGFWLFYSFEKEFSRFLIDSTLSKLNKEKELEVSNRFIKVLEKVSEVYKNTDKFFNPLINLSNIWYSKSFNYKDFEQTETKTDLDFENISIIWNFITLKENHNLDLGWIVKWYSVDAVKKYLKDLWYKNFIINAGWDIYLSWKTSENTTPVVWIDNPFKPWEPFASIEVTNKSVSTSWTYKRKWKIKDKDYHHIINPKDDSNKDEIVSITLITNDCYISDSYATACFNMWIEKTLVFLEEKNITWILISSSGDLYHTKNIEEYNLNIF